MRSKVFGWPAQVDILQLARSNVVTDARIDLDVIEMAQHMRSFIGTGPAGTVSVRMDLVRPRVTSAQVRVLCKL